MTSKVEISSVQQGQEQNAISVNSLTYAFSGYPPVVSDVTLQLPRGSRCLLIGANGAGKTTLLQIVAGKYMVPKETVQILGRSAFHDMNLICSGELSYLGTAWRRDIAGAGNNVALQGDLSARRLIFGIEGADPVRREKLLKLLDIDLNWHMHQVSDGQRRRVQICMGLMIPYQVLLLDEITVDMDVVGRLDLLDFLKEECEQRGATILYATHIFDGLNKWLTHMAYISDGKLSKGGPADQIAGLNSQRKLLHVVEEWLREEHDNRRQRGCKEAEAAARKTPVLPSKHLMYFR